MSWPSTFVETSSGIFPRVEDVQVVTALWWTAFPILRADARILFF